MNGFTYESAPLIKQASIMHPSERFLWIEENDPRGENMGPWGMHAPNPPTFNNASLVDSVASWHGGTSSFNCGRRTRGQSQMGGHQNGDLSLSNDPNKYYNSTLIPNYVQAPHDIYFLANAYADEQNP